jgi:hypothetical protein
VRKRLVIGAIAVAVIVVAAYVLSQPKKGTIAYHKARYLRLAKKSEGETLGAKTVRAVNSVLGTRFRTRPDPLDLALLMSAEHEELLRLGFLIERKYHFTNVTLEIDARWISEGVYASIAEEHAHFSAFGLLDGATNVLLVIAPREDIPVWEKFIAEADRCPTN